MTVKIHPPTRRQDFLMNGMVVGSGLMQLWGGGSAFLAGLFVATGVWMVVLGELVRRRDRALAAELRRDSERWLAVFQTAVNATQAELRATWKN